MRDSVVRLKELNKKKRVEFTEMRMSMVLVYRKKKKSYSVEHIWKRMSNIWFSVIPYTCQTFVWGNVTSNNVCVVVWHMHKLIYSNGIYDVLLCRFARAHVHGWRKNGIHRIEPIRFQLYSSIQFDFRNLIDLHLFWKFL